MHASSILAALALVGTAVSVEIIDGVKTQFFPKSMYCKGYGKGARTFQQSEILKAVVAGDRSGTPIEKSAGNMATEKCSGQTGSPLWSAIIGDTASISYALSSDGIFSFCGTTSGKHSSGWPDRCTLTY